jgi:XTP/dITP diphosphohydrolase
MSSIPQDNRQAAFHITLTVGTSDSNVAQFSAESHGSIATEMRGTNGFGYDPIFIGNDTDGSTYAELDACRKSSRSHRTRAFINAFDYMIIHCLKST